MASSEKREKLGEIIIDEHFCKGCGLCVDACPKHLIRIAEHVSDKGYYPAEYVDPDRNCSGCTLCAQVCPDVAIQVFKQDKSAGEHK